MAVPPPSVEREVFARQIRDPRDLVGPETQVALALHQASGSFTATSQDQAAPLASDASPRRPARNTSAPTRFRTLPAPPPC